jgi:hypothetical protein
MSAKYYGHTTIVGLDIARKTLTLDPGVTLVQGLQDDPALLARPGFLVVARTPCHQMARPLRRLVAEVLRRRRPICRTGTP